MPHRTTTPSLFADAPAAPTPLKIPAGSPPTATAEPAATPAPPATEPSHQAQTANPSPNSASSSASAPTTTPSTPASSPSSSTPSTTTTHASVSSPTPSSWSSRSRASTGQLPRPQPLWQEAKNRIARLDAFEISHALRHKNKDADRLANQAMDRGMKRPHTPGQPAPEPLKATPYPTKSSAPPNPDAQPKPAAMLRGFTRDGVVHVLGGTTLPDGIFVKIIPE